MLSLLKRGLFAPAGNFYIDPNGAVENAVVTHAHSDHARRGAQTYYCVHSGRELLQARLGRSIRIQSYDYGEVFQLGGIRLSFHPAGHILGSSQVRLESGNEVWVVSGDYKREPDPSCEPFEVLKCDVFVTEATFGTPAYVWPKTGDRGHEIFEWWQRNSRKNVNSILFGYSLGKTQRILSLLAPHADRPVYCHGASRAINEAYARQGIQMAPAQYLEDLTPGEKLVGELIIAPQSLLKNPPGALAGTPFLTAFASGWMVDRGFGYDNGFTISDHADWNDLVRTCLETGAQRIYVQHRGPGALVRYLREQGIKAFADSELVPQNPAQMAFL